MPGQQMAYCDGTTVADDRIKVRLFILSCVLAFSGTAAAAGPHYVLRVDPAGAEVRVVMGRKLLRFRGEGVQLRSVDEWLAPGSNAVRLGWTGVASPAEVAVVRLSERGRAEVLFRYRIDGVLRPHSGVLTVAVVRDRPQDVPLLDEQTEQLIKNVQEVKLSTFVAKGLMRLTLNGQPLGDYASLEQRDVTPYLKRGRNTLKVVWSKDFGSSIPSAELRVQLGDEVLARWQGPRLWSLTGTDLVNFEY